MNCPICGAVVVDTVMRAPLAKSVLRCAQCGIHFVIGRTARVLPFVTSSIGPITFPKVTSGGNRLDTWPPSPQLIRSTTH
jgi:hypothetical protein